MNQKRTQLSIAASLAIIMLLNACGPSVAEQDAAATQASIEEYATQTAQAPPSTRSPTIPLTNTPLPPTKTPTPTDTLTPPSSTPTPTATVISKGEL